MVINFEVTERTLIANIVGDIDHHTSDDMRNKIDNEYSKNNCKNIILDFSGVTFMDSSGIGMVIGRYKNVEKYGGTLAIADITEEINRIFLLSGLHKIIKSYSSLKKALESMR